MTDKLCRLPDCTVVRETQRAIMIECPFGDMFWIPKSKLCKGSVAREGINGTLVVPWSFAEQKGIV